MDAFKPMLACSEPVEKQLAAIKFPCFASPKLDGIRAIARQGDLYTRSLKLVPNRYIREQFKELAGADGELIIGRADRANAFMDTGAIRRLYEECDVYFHVFDTVHPDAIALPYNERLNWVIQNLRVHPRVQLVTQHVVHNMEELAQLEGDYLEQGYEGLIVRSWDGKYKYGRSTLNEGIMFKVKRFMDAEAEVIGFEERMRNENEATISELGRTKRSSHQENLVGRGDLGAITCRFGGSTFNIGTGFDDAQRAEIWANRGHYLGQLVKFKYLHVGMKTAPRHPVFLGWRMKEDV